MNRRVSVFFRAAAFFALLGTFLGWMEVAMPDVHDGHGSAEPEAGWVQLAHGHPPEAPGHAPQSPHTCHCIHAHVPALPANGDASARTLPHHLRFASAERALASVAPEPHFRPPVA